MPATSTVDVTYTAAALQEKLEGVEADIAARTDAYAVAVVSGDGDVSHLQGVIDELHADADAVRIALHAAQKQERAADARAMQVANAIQAAQAKKDARQRQVGRLTRLADYLGRVATLTEKRAEVEQLEREAAAVLDFYLMGQLVRDARADLHSEDGIRRGLAAGEGGNAVLMREAAAALIDEAGRLEVN